MKRYNIENNILIDFRKIGYGLKVNILIKIALEKREEIRGFTEKL